MVDHEQNYNDRAARTDKVLDKMDAKLDCIHDVSLETKIRLNAHVDAEDNMVGELKQFMKDNKR
ncbi:unnamed protein product [marine sediment metagenome]|uniref:Uncharacterized protein n=1 Tax=marine sediment metagenome TaxID=412755 RepID=X0XEE4_9ZZZZ